MRNWKPDCLGFSGTRPTTHINTSRSSGDNLWQIFFPSFNHVCPRGRKIQVCRLPNIIINCLSIFPVTTEGPEFSKLWIYIYGLCMHLSFVGSVQLKSEHLLHSTEGKKWRLEDLKCFCETSCFSVCFSLGCNRVNFLSPSTQMC